MGPCLFSIFALPKAFPRHLQAQPRLAQSPAAVRSPAMRGQQQADPSGRNPCVTGPGLPLTPRLLDLPGTSEGQREKVKLHQKNSEGLKKKKIKGSSPLHPPGSQQPTQWVLINA